MKSGGERFSEEYSLELRDHLHRLKEGGYPAGSGQAEQYSFYVQMVKYVTCYCSFLV